MLYFHRKMEKFSRIVLSSLQKFKYKKLSPIFVAIMTYWVLCKESKFVWFIVLEDGTIRLGFLSFFCEGTDIFGGLYTRSWVGKKYC